MSRSFLRALCVTFATSAVKSFTQDGDDALRTQEKETIELMMLMLSVVLGIVPLLGVAWIFLKSSVTTVDGLFMSLILLALSAILFLNVFLELRGKQKKSATQKAN